MNNGSIKCFMPILSAVCLCLTGCVSVPDPGAVSSDRRPAEVHGSKAAVFEFIEAAETRDDVLRSIGLLEGLQVQYPDDLEILSRLSNLYIFKGAACETKVSAKRKAYVEALRYAETALRVSPAFRREIERGTMLWDAVDVLDEPYVPALSFWSTALFYQFDECVNKLMKPFHLKWIKRAEAVLGRAYELEPDWGGGQLYFSYGIYYLMPKVAGGDMVKSEAFFNQAVEAGPDWLLNRWGRGRYYYRKTGERDALKADLEWVIRQDAADAPGPLYWNVYCRKNAETILNDL